MACDGYVRTSASGVVVGGMMLLVVFDFNHTFVKINIEICTSVVSILLCLNANKILYS